MHPKTLAVLPSCLLSIIALANCGGSSSTGPSSNPTPIVTPTPTPTPTPAPTQPPPCQLTAPTVKCAERKVRAQELADFLQPALNAAKATPGAMYANNPDRIYDLDLFRSKVIDHLTAKGICGAWDYGGAGDELYTRSADGCVVEQYDPIASDGGVRAANRKSNVWSGGWEEKVPAPRPQYARRGDLTCSLPGDRTTFCFMIKGTGGAFGPALFAALVEVLDENPTLVDKGDFLPGQGQPVPAALRPAAWRILNTNGYVNALQAKIRARGYCGWVDKGDILMVKSVEMGNIFHEEIDVIQNPASGGDYTAFVVKDRCHNAGF